MTEKKFKMDSVSVQAAQLHTGSLNHRNVILPAQEAGLELIKQSPLQTWDAAS